MMRGDGAFHCLVSKGCWEGGDSEGFGGINSLNRLVTRSSSEPNPSGEH